MTFEIPCAGCGTACHSTMWVIDGRTLCADCSVEEPTSAYHCKVCKRDLREEGALLQCRAHYTSETLDLKTKVSRLELELAQTHIEIGELSHELTEAEVHHQVHHEREGRMRKAIEAAAEYCPTTLDQMMLDALKE